MVIATELHMIIILLAAQIVLYLVVKVARFVSKPAIPEIWRERESVTWYARNVRSRAPGSS